MTHEEMAQAVEYQRLSLTPGSKAYKGLTEAAAALRRLDMAPDTDAIRVIDGSPRVMLSVEASRRWMDERGMSVELLP